MTTMPWRSNAISLLPDLLGIGNSSHFANDFMSRNSGQRVTEKLLLNSPVAMTDADRKDFQKDLIINEF